MLQKLSVREGIPIWEISISFNFDDGTQEKGQLTPEGIQIGNNFFEKVSDSTLLPPTHRLKSNMEDIAKGLKIAGAIGGAAVKAAKTIQDTITDYSGNAIEFSFSFFISKL